MSHQVRFKLHPLSVAVLATFAVFPAFAQQQATPSNPASSASSSEANALPTVKVTSDNLSATTEGTGSYTTSRTGTATPLSLSPRDTPQSVSIVTQQRIEDQKLLTITDVVNNVTGVSVNQYETNRGQFNARGFNINTLMIDGVPTTWEQAWSSGEIMTSLAMYDRVEVVRGATGLTTGAGNPSAAINLVRKRASSKELMGTAEVGIGSWNERRLMADVSTPVNEAKTVRARVVGEFRDRDSWVDGLENKNQTLFATFEADLGANTLLSAGMSYQENDSKGGMWGGLPAWYSDGTRTNWSRSKTTSADWVRWDSDVTNYFASLEHRFANDWKVRASYNYSDRNADSYLLYLSGFPNRATGLGLAAGPGSYLVNTRQRDIGVQLSGPFELLGQKHELAFGYVHSNQVFDANRQMALGASAAAPNFNTWTSSTYPEPGWASPFYYSDSETTQKAFYAAGRFKLADPLQLILGARVNDYEKSGGTIRATSLGVNRYDIKHSSEITPYAGIIYDINDNFSVYASHTDIFLPQQQRNIEGNYLDPIEGKSTEAGVKGEFMDGRLNASFAVFKIKQDNLAQATTQLIPGSTPPETAYIQSEGATSKGFELELSGELARGWNASIGYSQFEAEDAKGKDVNPLYPRKTLKVFTTYRLPGEWNALTVGGGVNWQSKIYTEARNPANVLERLEQGSFALVNLMARYEISRQLSAQLNINNLLDKETFNSSTGGQITYGAPRNAMVTLNYKF